MTIWLVQYLCPRRHAICAAPYEEGTDPAEIEGRILARMHQFGVLAQCGICGSRELHFEHGKMGVTTWDDAMRLLQDTQRANLATRALIDSWTNARN